MDDEGAETHLKLENFDESQIILIQSTVRGYLVRRWLRDVRQLYEGVLHEVEKHSNIGVEWRTDQPCKPNVVKHAISKKADSKSKGERKSSMKASLPNTNLHHAPIGGEDDSKNPRVHISTKLKKPVMREEAVTTDGSKDEAEPDRLGEHLQYNSIETQTSPIDIIRPYSDSEPFSDSRSDVDTIPDAMGEHLDMSMQERNALHTHFKENIKQSFPNDENELHLDLESDIGSERSVKSQNSGKCDRSKENHVSKILYEEKSSVRSQTETFVEEIDIGGGYTRESEGSYTRERLHSTADSDHSDRYETCRSESVDSEIDIGQRSNRSNLSDDGRQRSLRSDQSGKASAKSIQSDHRSTRSNQSDHRSTRSNQSDHRSTRSNQSEKASKISVQSNNRSTKSYQSDVDIIPQKSDRSQRSDGSRSERSNKSDRTRSRSGQRLGEHSSRKEALLDYDDAYPRTDRSDRSARSDDRTDRSARSDGSRSQRSARSERSPRREMDMKPVHGNTSPVTSARESLRRDNSDRNLSKIDNSDRNVSRVDNSSQRVCQDSTSLTNVTSVWDSYASVRESHDVEIPAELPQDPEKLRQVRKNIAMELLWVQQAISSRKNYLKLKNEM